jgi:hypothetical protein
MRDVSEERGFTLVDTIVGVALLSLVILAAYHVNIPTFALWRSLDAGLATQQDVRLAVDRVARALRETTPAFGRLRVYAPEEGCRGAYEGCIGFVTPRGAQCGGPFQLSHGAPDWQSTIYVWRDTASNELRLRCDVGTTFPVATWPPTLEPFTVIGSHVTAASFGLEPTGSTPTSVSVLVEEGVPTSGSSAHPSRATFFNRTVFAPQNR